MTDTACTECGPFTCSRCGRSWVEQPAFPTVEPRVVTIEDLGRPAWASEDPANYATDDAMGWSYAFGRMDQGHPPVAIVEPDRAPSSTGTAWLFGRMWAAIKHEERDPNIGGYFPGLQSAWDNFVASGGRTLRRR